MKIKLKSPKKRNPYVMSCRLRNGKGAHDKPYKTKRSQDKIALKKKTLDR